MMMSFSEVTTMVLSAGGSLSPVNPNSLSWVPSTGIASQLYILEYGYDMLGMHGVEVGLHLLFFFVFLLSLCHGFYARTDMLQHCCISFS